VTELSGAATATEAARESAVNAAKANLESTRKAIEVARKIAASRGAHVADVPHVAKLSITGVGIRSHAGVADRLFKPLADCGINIDLVSTSEVRLNVIVAAEHGQTSLAVLRKAFRETAADKDLDAEATKTGNKIDPIFGEDAQKIMERLYATPQALRAHPEMANSFTGFKKNQAISIPLQGAAGAKVSFNSLGSSMLHRLDSQSLFSCRKTN
jgi:predicted amino acid-binding ACT domain protein